MRNLVAVIFAAGLVAATEAPAAAEPRPVFKVDKVTATIVNARLVITASGAVTTGGWADARLHMVNFHKPDGDTEIVQFLASPPLADAIVIQALVPVATTATFPLPPTAVTRVKVVSASNSVTTAIVPAR